MPRTLAIVIVGLLSALLIVVVIVGVMVAQSGTFAGQLQPIAINIRQAVPVDLVLPITLRDGTEMTVSAPVTVSIALQVQIDGAEPIASNVSTLKPVAVTVSEGTAVFDTLDDNEPLAAEGMESIQGMGTDAGSIALLESIYDACDNEMTTAQKQVALDNVRPELANRKVQFTGTVQDVRNLTGSYDIIVSLDRVGREIMVENVPMELALSLKKGSSVLLTGQLDIPACGFYVQLDGLVTVR